MLLFSLWAGGGRGGEGGELISAGVSLYNYTVKSFDIHRCYFQVKSRAYLIKGLERKVVISSFDSMNLSVADSLLLILNLAYMAECVLLIKSSILVL